MAVRLELIGADALGITEGNVMAKEMEGALAETGLRFAELRFKWSAIALTLLSILIENGLLDVAKNRLSYEEQVLIEKDEPGILTKP